MATEIVVPTLGESVSEASVMKWFKKVGDAVAVDEALTLDGANKSSAPSRSKKASAKKTTKKKVPTSRRS